MATPAKKLAESLDVLKSIQDTGRVAIRSADLSRTHRERLLKNGFIQEVMKGWYIPSSPNEASGESTRWYASFWGFCRDYLTSRFGEQWCLGPEQSIRLLIGNWTVPNQLVVRTPKGGNKATNLLYGTSVLDLKLELIAKGSITTPEGIRVMTLPAALINCSENYYKAQSMEARTALSMLTDVTELLRALLEGQHSTIAGRIAGALRDIGRPQLADTILDTMRSAGFKVQESNPFTEPSVFLFTTREGSPYVNRLRMLWKSFRESIIEHFPQAPSKPLNIESYLKQIDDIYVNDAYNSLSIEGYQVSEGLIERVRSGAWNPDTTASDLEQQNALAARGYWQAFQTVKDSVKKVLEKKNAGEVVESDHSIWYRELFSPSVQAGIISAADLAGYRNRPVYIRKSRHTPPNYESVRELMPAFFELLKEEENPAVRVILGHFIFVYIHPYVDGNGRTGRFLMNVMLASGGYPWLIIPVDKRNEYMESLEAASVEQNIIPFTKFIASLVE